MHFAAKRNENKKKPKKKPPTKKTRTNKQIHPNLPQKKLNKTIQHSKNPSIWNEEKKMTFHDSWDKQLKKKNKQANIPN